MFRVLLAAALLAFVPLLVYSNAAPKRVYGHVIAAPEGDALIIATAGQKQLVRLAGIDAPQLPQPYGMKSRESLSALALGQDIACIEQTTYRQNGIIAFCAVQETDLSAEQVRRGYAWAYDAYEQLRVAQEAARAARVGLWVDPQPIPPWRW